MEFHKSLYKSINFGNTTNNSPKNRIKQNLKSGRQTKRNEIFQQNRVFSISPTPSKNKKGLQKCEDNSTVLKSLNIKNKENSTSKVGATSGHENYVAKFIAWKRQKEIEKKQKTQKKPPFVSACSRNGMFSQSLQKSIAPENHKFKAPANLIMPGVSENCKYVIRNTGLEKQKTAAVQELNLSHFITANKKLGSTQMLLNKPKIISSIDSVTTKKPQQKVVLSAKKITRPQYDKTKKIIDQFTNKNLGNVKKENIVGVDHVDIDKRVRNNEKFKPGTFVKVFKPPTSLPSVPNIKNNDAQIKNVVRAKSPKVGKSKSTSSSGNNKNDNVIAKEKNNLVQMKKSVSIKSPKKIEKGISKKPFLVEKTPYKNPAYLKRGIKSNSKNNNLKINSKTQTKTKNENGENKPEIQPSKLVFFEKPKLILCQETPVEGMERSITSFCTSTQRKLSSNSNGFLPVDVSASIISPIEAEELKNYSNNCVPLINIFVDRQSLAKIEKKNEILAFPLDTLKSPDTNKTPTNLEVNKEEKPINYLSPYVTMSRGKGNNKNEKKLRESLYVSEDPSEGIASTEMRRVEETVRYFRKILNDEIDRLHKRCEEWEQYVKHTDPAILEDCAYDMINVAMGQTGLLINKKFNQFKNLIEQCVKFAEIKYNLKKNTDKEEKSVLPKDLEGFWQMMYIQVDDIDERFRKLECWKANNWKDPDEIHDEIEEKVKKKNKLLTKIYKKKKAPTANPELKKKLKEMYMAYKENKKQELEENDNDILILTPSKKSTKSITSKNDNATSTPLRRSGRISNAKPILTPQSGTPSRKSLRIETAINAASKIFESNNGTSKNGMSDFRLISLVRTPCIACPADSKCSPKPRKSILKTPGTQKKRHTVIFNEDLQFKSPDKAKNRRSSSAKQSLSGSSNKKERKRSLNLRARRLILDPELKIEIPVKRY